MSGFFSFLIGHAYSWQAKLLYIAIAMAIWHVYVDPYLAPVKIYMLWLENMTIFTVLSKATCQFILDAFYMAATFRLVLWFLDPHSPVNPHGHPSTPTR